MTAATIAAALGGKPSGSGWVACCPAHDDKEPSLSLSESENRILLHCHAGCSQDAVIAALQERGLWPGGNGNGNGRHELARYDYRDASGKVLYQVARFEPKDFRCYSPATDTWSIKGLAALPYHLPELQAALVRGEPVVICEGEKDADRLAALSIVATTNHGGSGNIRVWKDHLAQYFPRGARVILMGDSDKPGQAHMDRIAEILQARGVEVLRVSPEALGFEVTEDHGRDVTDWLAAGHTRDELIEVLALAAPAKDNSGNITTDPLAAAVSCHTLHDAVMPPRIWYIEGVLTPGFNLVTGRKALKKSWLLQQAGNAIAEGFPWLGRRTLQVKVLWVSFELDDGDLHDRLNTAKHLSDNMDILYSWPSGDKALELAERAIVENGYRVIIFDTFLPLIPQDGLFKINEYADTTFYLKWRLMAKRHKAAIVGAWHEGKTLRDDFMLAGIGSAGMIGQADSVISIDAKRGDLNGRLLIGGNHGLDSVIHFTFENGIFTLAEGQEAIDRLTLDEVATVTALTGRPEGCTTAAVALAMAKSEEAARKSLGRLMARGIVTRPHRGLYCLSNGQTDNSGQFQFCPKGQPDRTHTYRECVQSVRPVRSGRHLRERASHRQGFPGGGHAMSLPLLRFMSYGEYLQTPHWRETRAAAIARAGGRCALCPRVAEGLETSRLNVHHRTYEVGRQLCQRPA